MTPFGRCSIREGQIETLQFHIFRDPTYISITELMRALKLSSLLTLLDRVRLDMP